MKYESHCTTRFNSRYSYNPGQNYVDSSSRKAFLHISRTPLPPDNADAMIFIFTCSQHIGTQYC